MTDAKQLTTLSTVGQMMEKHKAQIAAALPKHLTPDRMCRLALTCIRDSKQLQEAHPLDLLGAVMRCVQDGLEPGRTAYIIPFRNTKQNRMDVQYIPDYRGLIELARNSGLIGTFYGEIVHDGDFFEFERGTAQYLRHRPRGDTADITHAYAVAISKDGQWSDFVVLTKPEIDRVRNRSRAGKSGPWATDYDAMAKKTAIRRLAKVLPSSPELRSAILADEMADTGGQRNRGYITGEIEADEPEAPPTPAETLVAEMEGEDDAKV